MASQSRPAMRQRNGPGKRKKKAEPPESQPPKIRLVNIEIALGVRPRYRGGQTPPQFEITPAAVKDSNAFIVEKAILPKSEAEINKNTQKRLVYIVGWPDVDVHLTVDATRILDYVDPWTLEEYEYQEHLRLEAGKSKAKEEEVKKPGRSKRLKKSRLAKVEEAIATPEMSEGEEMRVAARHQASGPSLMTPPKPTLPALDPDESSDEAAVVRHLQGEESDQEEMEEDEMDLLDTLRVSSRLAAGDMAKQPGSVHSAFENRRSSDPVCINTAMGWAVSKKDASSSLLRSRPKSAGSPTTSKMVPDQPSSTATPPLFYPKKDSASLAPKDTTVKQKKAAAISLSPHSSSPSSYPDKTLAPESIDTVTQKPELGPDRATAYSSWKSGEKRASSSISSPGLSPTWDFSPEGSPQRPAKKARIFLSCETSAQLTSDIQAAPGDSTAKPSAIQVLPSPSNETALKALSSKPKPNSDSDVTVEVPDPNDEARFNIKEILNDERKYDENGVPNTFYQVLWAGDGPKFQNPSWEPEANIMPDVIETYLAKKAKQSSPGKGKKPGTKQLSIVGFLSPRKYSSVADAVADEEIDGDRGGRNDAAGDD